jgi:O-acetyl-ADP-ribose deacetylase (regulator of RNase III)
MIRECEGNLIEHPSDALVNTVNTVGVMGKGIALQFRRAYPAMFKAYEKACKNGEVQLGKMHVWETNAITGPRFIINFPTKGHWKSKSQINAIEEGLKDLVQVISAYGITSIAVPPLGCGNGGLSWNDVRPRIESSLGSLPIDVCLFSPGQTPEAASMPTMTKRPAMTRARSVLLRFMDRYSEVSVGTSLIEAHKGMYFFDKLDSVSNLGFSKARYGPYSDRLAHVIADLEGHFVQGYGDGTASVTEAEPLFVFRDAASEASTFLAGDTEAVAQLDEVFNLIAGFETPYFMELLATVHFVASENPLARTDVEIAGELVRSWSPRKAGLFGQDHVEACWNRLNTSGWLAGVVGPH